MFHWLLSWYNCSPIGIWNFREKRNLMTDRMLHSVVYLFTHAFPDYDA